MTRDAKPVYYLDMVERDEWLEKGLGEMDVKELKVTTMDPASRKLIRVTIDEDGPGDLVERLLGKKSELQFRRIQRNTRFVEELNV